MTTSNLALQTQLKNPTTALILAIFGFHYVYMGKIGLQLFYWCTCGGFGFWWLIDIFRASGMVDKANQSVILQMEINEIKNNQNK